MIHIQKKCNFSILQIPKTKTKQGRDRFTSVGSLCRGDTRTETKFMIEGSYFWGEASANVTILAKNRKKCSKVGKTVCDM